MTSQPIPNRLNSSPHYLSRGVMSDQNVIQLFPKLRAVQPPKSNVTSDTAAVNKSILEAEQCRYQEAMKKASVKLIAEDTQDEENLEVVHAQRSVHNLIIQSIDLWFPRLFNLDDNAQDARRVRNLLQYIYPSAKETTKVAASLHWLDNLGKVLRTWQKLAYNIDQAAKVAESFTKAGYENLFDTHVRIYAALLTFPSENELNRFLLVNHECYGKLGPTVLLDPSKQLKERFNNQGGPLGIAQDATDLLNETSEIYAHLLAQYLSSLVDGYRMSGLKSQYIEAFESGRLWSLDK